MRPNQTQRNAGDRSNLLWATFVILSMAASCAVYTSYVVQSVLSSLRSTDAMVVLLTDSGVASDDQKLERNLNAAQRALEASGDMAMALTVACLIVAIGLIVKVCKSSRVIMAVAAMFLVVGCKSSSPELPAAEPAPKAVELDKVGKDLDVIDSRVAAAVVVAREANTAGKPAVVESELSIASSYLPKAAENDVAFARQRSEKASPAEYEAQRKKASEKQKQLEKEWAVLEDQVKLNRVAIEARDKRITELQGEMERIKKDASANLWTLAGIAMSAAGAACCIFMGPKIGIPLLGFGMAMGAVPFVIDSPFFSWIVAGTLGCLALLLLWYAWDWVRDRTKDKPAP